MKQGPDPETEPEEYLKQYFTQEEITNIVKNERGVVLPKASMITGKVLTASASKSTQHTEHMGDILGNVLKNKAMDPTFLDKINAQPSDEAKDAFIKTQCLEAAKDNMELKEAKDNHIKFLGDKVNILKAAVVHSNQLRGEPDPVQRANQMFHININTQLGQTTLMKSTKDASRTAVKDFKNDGIPNIFNSSTHIQQHIKELKSKANVMEKSSSKPGNAPPAIDLSNVNRQTKKEFEVPRDPQRNADNIRKILQEVEERKDAQKLEKLLELDPHRKQYLQSAKKTTSESAAALEVSPSALRFMSSPDPRRLREVAASKADDINNNNNVAISPRKATDLGDSQDNSSTQEEIVKKTRPE